ncbi:MAG: hypothetical protein H7Y15_05760 [Pseudonocardia sp.]|nr:hypothetical protein [Pseudonocardia sp.]
MPAQSPDTTALYPPAVLRVAPDAIPAVRKALDDTLAELSPHLLVMRQAGYIDEPWLGDPMSEYVRVTYNATVMDAPDGPYQALVAYEGQLIAARDALAAAEAEYVRTEGENSDIWGRLV